MIDQGYAWAYDGGTKEKNYEELLGKRYDGKEVL